MKTAVKLRKLNPRNRNQYGYVCPDCKNELALYFKATVIINNVLYDEYRCDNHGSFYIEKQNIMKTKHTRKPLKRYPGYEIDIKGNIWSLWGWRGIKERKLIGHPNKDGYLRVTLKINNSRKTEFIHNLMIENFIGNKDGLQTRHLDGNRQNNVLSNLILGTAKENADDREKHGNTSRGKIHAELIQLRKENYRLKRELSSPIITTAPDMYKLLDELAFDLEGLNTWSEVDKKYYDKIIEVLEKIETE